MTSIGLHPPSGEAPWTDPPHRGPPPLWPYRPRPLADELLSSWLMRLIMGYQLKRHTFCSALWPGKPIWNRDIDRCVDQEIVELLAEHTGRSTSQFRDMSLHAYVGTVFEALPSHGHVPWLLSVGMYHRLRKLHGQQYCPACLADDETPYFRKIWRLAFATICPIHHLPLRDACPHCGSVVMFHQSPMKPRDLSLCHACHRPLSHIDDPAPSERESALWRSAESIQEHMMTAMNIGWAFPEADRPVHALVYFSGLRVLALGLRSRRTKGRLFKAVSSLSKGSLNLGDDSQSMTLFELMRVTDRLRVMAALGWLMSDWPNQLLAACREAGVRYSDLFPDRRIPPYWLVQALWPLKSSKYWMLVNRARGRKREGSPAKIPKPMVPMPVFQGVPQVDLDVLRRAFLSWYHARRIEGVSPRTINRDLRCVYGFVRHVGKVPWRCDEGAIDVWHEEIGLVRKLAPATQLTYLYALRSFLVCLERQRWFRQVLPGVKLPVLQNRHRVPYNPAVKAPVVDESRQRSITGHVSKTPEALGMPKRPSDIGVSDEAPRNEALERRHVRPHTRCDHCGRSMHKAARVYEDRAYCATCYAREFEPVSCRRCGKTVRTFHGKRPALCKSCGALDRECVRCGKPVRRAGLTLKIGVVCGSCAKHFRKPEKCSNCGRLSKNLARDFKRGFNEPVCPTCRTKGNAVCARCGKYRPIRGHRRDGSPLCGTCVETGDKPFLCPCCGKEGKRHSSVMCQACYWDSLFVRRLDEGLKVLRLEWVREGWMAYAKERRSALSANQAAIKLKKHLSFFLMLEEASVGAQEKLDLDELFDLLKGQSVGKYHKPWRVLAAQGWVPALDSPEMGTARRMAWCRRMLDEAATEWYGHVLKEYWEYLVAENRRWGKKGWNEYACYSPRTMASYIRAAALFLEAVGDVSGGEVSYKSFRLYYDEICRLYPGHRNSMQPFLKFIDGGLDAS